MGVFTKIKTGWQRMFNNAGETLSEEYIGKNAPKRLRYGLYSSAIVLVLLDEDCCTKAASNTGTRCFCAVQQGSLPLS